MVKFKRLSRKERKKKNSKVKCMNNLTTRSCYAKKSNGRRKEKEVGYGL